MHAAELSIGRSVIKSDSSPSLGRGIRRSLDREHQALVKSLDCVIQNLEANPLSENVREILSRIGGQLIDHFESEEKVIKGLGMPDDAVARHIDAHIAIIEQITRLSIALMKGETISRDALIATLKRWIVDHLSEHDLKI
jgi:hemerythrin-like metal-binding protein